MNPNKSSRLYRNVTCPFCSLLCDDLSIRNDSGTLSVERQGCALAIRNFERSQPRVEPTIHGEIVSLEDAIDHAACILRKAKHPMFAGCSTDVDGCRELMALAEQSGAIIDHVHGDAIMNNIQVLQNKGWITTTLAELKNRADLIIFIGTDASSRYPRFFERFVWNQPSLAGLKKNARKIVYLGDGLNTRAGTRPDGTKASLIKCTKKDLIETLAVLRALLNSRDVQTDKLPPRRLAALKKLVAHVHDAQYGVIVWDAGEFSATDGDIYVETICELVKELNRHSRFAGLSLGGNNGGTSFTNVCAWQSGYPLRVSFNKGYPEYDPYTNSTKNILQKKSLDALLWLSCFDTSLVMPRTDVPTIIMSKPSKRLSQVGEVYIPVGTPGIDHVGTLLRTDTVVSLPLKKLRDIGLHSDSEILNRIRRAL